MRYLPTLGALLLSGCATTTMTQPHAHLTKEHFKHTTTLTAKAGEPYAQLSTEKGYEETYDGAREFTATYLVASVDRKTGKAGYALSFMDTTTQPRKMAKLSYASPEGWMEQQVKVKHGSRLCKGTECWNLESVSAVLPEDLLRAYAKRYAPGTPGSWPFRIAPDITGEISYAEIAGLLERVDDYRTTLGVTP